MVTPEQLQAMEAGRETWETVQSFMLPFTVGADGVDEYTQQIIGTAPDSAFATGRFKRQGQSGDAHVFMEACLYSPEFERLRTVSEMGGEFPPELADLRICYRGCISRVRYENGGKTELSGDYAILEIVDPDPRLSGGIVFGQSMEQKIYNASYIFPTDEMKFMLQEQVNELVADPLDMRAMVPYEWVDGQEAIPVPGVEVIRTPRIRANRITPKFLGGIINRLVAHNIDDDEPVEDENASLVSFEVSVVHVESIEEIEEVDDED